MLCTIPEFWKRGVNIWCPQQRQNPTPNPKSSAVKRGWNVQQPGAHGPNDCVVVHCMTQQRKVQQWEGSLFVHDVWNDMTSVTLSLFARSSFPRWVFGSNCEENRDANSKSLHGQFCFGHVASHVAIIAISAGEIVSCRHPLYRLSVLLRTCKRGNPTTSAVTFARVHLVVHVLASNCTNVTGRRCIRSTEMGFVFTWTLPQTQDVKPGRKEIYAKDCSNCSGWDSFALDWYQPSSTVPLAASTVMDLLHAKLIESGVPSFCLSLTCTRKRQLLILPRDPDFVRLYSEICLISSTKKTERLQANSLHRVGSAA